jgi:hypothetical protein
MKTSVTSSKSPLSGCGVVLAVTLLILTVPHEALARGGVFHLFSAAQAATVTSPRAEVRTETHSPTVLGSCGGKRYRDPNTHRCRGPADY